ncbi:hypothetical protein EMIHUDRAFT_253222 [Emiliania huxleyi CCMP1516]|uniref:Uncharacterized protein n=2 Tax=Emiliania huxleyi TaxID=2903 RepID=A0A0D3KAZ4_EMIH1|nr:hypothetical protein EMIHUDRAFT_253222 [Emiliania huxleyi CCMP1516]EOD32929.1 hypothetical protein EMIHUDRAFT_253222 [Emiliania huxleyi CCMP1516]|eukprot:XP_005785358.1 hypothetical protein EMIHUDRAFT_253222 [Emiliania huxleyi CCMP1516]
MTELAFARLRTIVRLGEALAVGSDFLRGMDHTPPPFGPRGYHTTPRKKLEPRDGPASWADGLFSRAMFEGAAEFAALDALRPSLTYPQAAKDIADAERLCTDHPSWVMSTLEQMRRRQRTHEGDRSELVCVCVSLVRVVIICLASTHTALSALDLLSLGASFWSIHETRQTHQNAVQVDRDLHVRGLAAAAEHHYQQLIAELLAAAKEADRDVWEQRNGQFNNLMLASILMFGVGMSAIIEGNFDLNDSGMAVIVFSFFEAVALSTLFLSLVSCLLVSRRMSIYMISRTGKLVERLSFIIKSADMLAADASNISSLPSPRKRGLEGDEEEATSVGRRARAQRRWKELLRAIDERRVPGYSTELPEAYNRGQRLNSMRMCEGRVCFVF